MGSNTSTLISPNFVITVFLYNGSFLIFLKGCLMLWSLYNQMWLYFFDQFLKVGHSAFHKFGRLDDEWINILPILVRKKVHEKGSFINYVTVSSGHSFNPNESVNFGASISFVPQAAARRQALPSVRPWRLGMSNIVWAFMDET